MELFLQFSPMLPILRHWLSISGSIMEFEEFDIEFLAQKMAENPQSPLFARLADLYIGKEQSAEVMKLLEEGIKLYPEYYAGYIVLGKAHLALKEYSKAQNAFEKAISLSPFNQTAAKLLLSVPNKPDESTRTTDETYFSPTVVQPEAEPIEEFTSPAPEPMMESAELSPFQTSTVEEMNFTQPVNDAISSPYEEPAIQSTGFGTGPTASSGTDQIFPSYDDYFAQNQSRVNTQSPISLDDYLSGDHSPVNSPAAEQSSSQVFNNETFDTAEFSGQPSAHVDPEPVFASPEQAQLFAEMNALNEETGMETQESTTDIDSLAEKLQSAEKIVPKENYQPQHPVPNEAQENQAYETDAVTPTLAEIYASQGEFRAAIQAYEILMFSQPAKGGEFQQRIRELQQQQMEKDGLI